MKAISLWEPWATAMRMGLKKNETRGWSTKYRGDLVICSARRRMDTVDRNLCHEVGIKPSTLLYGYAMCIVELYDVMPVHEFLGLMDVEFPKMEQKLGNYSPHRFIWRTRNLRPLDPFQIRGQQLLFNVDIPPELMPDKYATVHVGGHKVPLIGVPAEATREKCDACGAEAHQLQLELVGTQMLCPTCKPKM